MGDALRFEVCEDDCRKEVSFSKTRVTVGRSAANDICLQDRQASRVHCAIEVLGGSTRLTDLGSQNGTYVGGSRVLAVDLACADTIRVGAAEIRVLELPAGADTREAPLRERPVAELVKELSQERAFLLRLTAVARDVAMERELMPLLNRMLDAVLELTGAERAFVVLAGKDGGLETEASRNFQGTAVDHADVAVSRSIAQQVIAGGQPVFSINAREDERFREVQSIVNLGLRSVLCVPLRFRDEILGVVYIDNRLEAAAFSARDRDRLLAFADQVAVAVANARLFHELTDSNRLLAAARARLEALNRDLRRTVLDREAELASVRARLAGDDPIEGDLRWEAVGIVGRSPAMRRVFEILDRVIESDFPVLITGESGTGKELIARAVHRLGGRRAEPFVSENCAALPESLLESELFGSVKGAFTGAINRRGLLERANGGTLFLDEVSEMSPALQSKLLRFLQEGEFRPVGKNEPVRVDVRVISASNRDLRQLVESTRFREDLYYRLNVLPIHLPPLRSRREDIPILVERFVARAAAASGRPAPAVAPEVIEACARYAWPGNVRELENEVRRLVTLSDSALTVERLSPHVRQGGLLAAPEEDGDLTARVQAMEVREIRRALAEARGNKSRAAAALGISRFALNRKMEKYSIGAEE
ncbi:MAG: sigma 54-interacting transcriptional regulator [Planctomycetes bacterium]|nr:sigma 54-interacting transcriptional regulator [Planctomycetota bacterium]